MSTYSFFAQHYDLLMQDAAYPARAGFYREMLAQYGQGQGILLDLACGTGTLSIEMAQAGYEVIGVDQSEAMLSIARKKALEAGTEILFLQQRMQDLDLYGTVDACICTLDSLNHINSLRQLQMIVQKIALFLNPGGCFIFDVNTLYKHQYVLADHSFVYELPDLYCVWQNQYDPNVHAVDIRLDFFKNQGPYYHRESESFRESYYSDETLTDVLREAGFQIQGRFDDIAKAAPSAETQRITYVCQKNCGRDRSVKGADRDADHSSCE